MNKIENYLAFGFDNGCKNCSLEYLDEVYWNGWEYMVGYLDEENNEKWNNSLNSIICRKNFIDAVARGIYGKQINETMTNQITFDQALAIYNDTLPLFINKLLGKKN